MLQSVHHWFGFQVAHWSTSLVPTVGSGEFPDPAGAWLAWITDAGLASGLTPNVDCGELGSSCTRSAMGQPPLVVPADGPIGPDALFRLVALFASTDCALLAVDRRCAW